MGERASTFVSRARETRRSRREAIINVSGLVARQTGSVVGSQRNVAVAARSR
jgi:hypothetical protein